MSIVERVEMPGDCLNVQTESLLSGGRD